MSKQPEVPWGPRGSSVAVVDINDKVNVLKTTLTEPKKEEKKEEPKKKK